MKHSLTRGFTLIELLVVIAIIGILSSIVLASLNSSRGKAGDGSIKQTFQSMRSQSEIYYSDQTASVGYDGVCTNATTTVMLNAIKSAANLSTALNTSDSTAGSAGTVTCHDSVAGYAAQSPLKTNGANFWCIDSTGAAKQTTSVIAANAVVCP